MNGRARVLIADDDPEVLDIVSNMLEQDFEVVGAVSDGNALLESFEALRPDVVVTDINMPGLDGIEATRQIILQDPEAKIILLTVYEDPLLAQAGLRSGASGYVLKLTADTELAAAIRNALSGHHYLSPKIIVPAWQ